MLKRLFDIIFSLIGLVVLFPFFLFIGILIKSGSRGPVFYRGVRIGRFGKLFKIYKFRTLVANAERIGGPSTAGDDFRITKIGKILRKYKLDELPQLIDVLRGKMSFVGPRPEVPFYANMFTDEEKTILSIRPGITDWASLWNSNEGTILAGSPDPEKTYQEKIRPKKIELQLKYVREKSLAIDLRIVLQTLKKLYPHLSPPPLRGRMKEREINHDKIL